MRTAFTILIITVLAGLVLACNSTNGRSNIQLEPVRTERLEPSPGSLKIGVVGSFPYKDLHKVISEWATLYGPGPSYSRLMKFAMDAKTASYMPVVCDLCNSFEKIDSTTYEFNLNQQHQFYFAEEQVLRPVTGSDVIFSLNRMNELDSPHKILVDSIESIELLSPFQIRFILKYPDPDFFLKLASPYAVIIPEEFDVIENIPGSGPWIYSRGQSGQTNLHSASSHPGGTGSLKIEFPIAANQEMVLRMLKTGLVDVARIPESYWTEFEQDGFQSVVINRQGRGVIFGLNSNRAPFNNLETRQRIFSGLNPFSAIEESFGIGEISTGLPLASSDWQLPKHKIMNAFNGIEAELIQIEKPFVLVIANFGDDYIKHGELLVSQLKEKGAKVEAEIVTRAEYLERVWLDKDYDAFVGPLPPTDLPNHFALGFIHSMGEMNVTGGTPILDEVVEKFAKEDDPSIRADLANTLQEELLKHSLFFMAAGLAERWVLNDSVQNFIPAMPMGAGDLWSNLQKQ